MRGGAPQASKVSQKRHAFPDVPLSGDCASRNAQGNFEDVVMVSHEISSIILLARVVFLGIYNIGTSDTPRDR